MFDLEIQILIISAKSSFEMELRTPGTRPKFMSKMKSKAYEPVTSRWSIKKANPDVHSGKMIHIKNDRRVNTKPALFWFVVLCAGLLGLIIATALFAVSVYMYYEFGKWIAPGTKYEELLISGMTAREASLRLDQAWMEADDIKITNGIRNTCISPTELGIYLDTAAVSQMAVEIGRQGTATYQIVEMVSGLFVNRQIKPVYKLEIQEAILGLEKLNPSMSQPPINVSFYSANGELAVSPAAVGYTINIEDTVAFLQNNLEPVVKTGAFTLVMKPVLPEITDASSLLLNAQDILNRPAAFNIYDPITNEQITYQITRNELMTWLQVGFKNQKPSITFNEALITSYLDKLTDEIGQGRYIQSSEYAADIAATLLEGGEIQITLKYPTTKYQVEPGDTLIKIGWHLGIPSWMIVHANPGLNSNRLYAGTELIVPSKTDLLPLRVIPNKRIVISLRKQRLSVIQGENQIRQFVISTGIDRSPTQPGVFQIRTHVDNAYASVWDLYMPDFLGIYEASPGFMNGIHGLPMLSGGKRMWANSLGRPASYGCIILGLNEAEWLYNWAENGVIVEISD